MVAQNGREMSNHIAPRSLQQWRKSVSPRRLGVRSHHWSIVALSDIIAPHKIDTGDFVVTKQSVVRTIPTSSKSFCPCGPWLDSAGQLAAITCAQ
jgi:hypothetical protein